MFVKRFCAKNMTLTAQKEKNWNLFFRRMHAGTGPFLAVVTCHVSRGSFPTTLQRFRISVYVDCYRCGSPQICQTTAERSNQLRSVRQNYHVVCVDFFKLAGRNTAWVLSSDAVSATDFYIIVFVEQVGGSVRMQGKVVDLIF